MSSPNSYRDGKIWSHPDQLWEQHVGGVMRLARAYAQEKLQGALFHSEFSQVWPILLQTTTFFHDFGKATTYFQSYLFADEQEKHKERRPETRHSLISAVCAYHVTLAVLKRLDLPPEWWPFFAYAAVARHHVDLCTWSDLIDGVDEKRVTVMVRQIEAIDEELWKQARGNLLRSLPMEAEWEKVWREEAGFSLAQLRTWVKTFPEELLPYRSRWRKWVKPYKDLRRLERDIDNNPSLFEPYFRMQLLFSLLIDADKSQVGIRDEEVFNAQRPVLSVSVVERYKSRFHGQGSPIDALREDAYRRVMQHPIRLDQRIYHLNLPTGMGKTLTGFSFALRLRELVEQRSGTPPRIIYSLPFLSIIEQNYGVLQEVLRTSGKSLDSRWLLKHHHLSEVRYRRITTGAIEQAEEMEREMEYETGAAKLLIEGWNSEVVVTTFMQLFHTLIGYKNRNLRKYHRLSHAILILDEVQAIPHKYWLLVRTLLKQMTEQLDVYLLILTATDPQWFTPNEATYLLPPGEYEERLNRLELTSRLSPVTPEEWVAAVQWDTPDSILVIANTIQQAKRLFELIQEYVPREETTYLSTHIVPAERARRIEEIRRRRYRVVVSTQLVEAGVDIDFDRVFRDLAPMDSLQQSAGRCNRHGKRQGKMEVVQLVNEKGKSYASYIYDAVRLRVTEQLLQQAGSFSEADFSRLTNQYFRELKQRMSNEESLQLLRSLVELHYDGSPEDGKPSISQFSLIEDYVPCIDVFVEYAPLFTDKEEQEEDIPSPQRIWEQYLKLRKDPDRFRRKEAFDRLKKDFYQFVISVPVDVKQRPPLVEDFYYVSRDDLEFYYDAMTGYRNESVTLIW